LSFILVLASPGGFFLVQEETSTTTSEVRAAASQLVDLRQRFAPLFGRKEARGPALIYLQGLLSPTGRKSAELMVLAFGQPDDWPAVVLTVVQQET
jgi:hypothetical protein